MKNKYKNRKIGGAWEGKGEVEAPERKGVRKGEGGVEDLDISQFSFL